MMRSSLMFVCTLALLGSAARADVVLFSNFGPGMTYGDGGFFGDAIASASFPPQALAMMFTPGSSAQLTDIVLPLLITSGTDQLTVFLDADNNDQPGTILEQINVTPSTSVPQGGIVTATSVLHPSLIAGTSYWIVVGATTPNTRGAWYWNSVGDDPAAPPGDPSGSNQARSTTGPTGSWTLVAPGTSLPGVGPEARDAFEVDGVSSVPEPASVSLVALALLPLLVRLYKNRG